MRKRNPGLTQENRRAGRGIRALLAKWTRVFPAKWKSGLAGRMLELVASACSELVASAVPSANRTIQCGMPAGRWFRVFDSFGVHRAFSRISNARPEADCKASTAKASTLLRYSASRHASQLQRRIWWPLLRPLHFWRVRPCIDSCCRFGPLDFLDYLFSLYAVWRFVAIPQGNQRDGPEKAWSVCNGADESWLSLLSLFQEALGYVCVP
jgi:hypothetical protein